MTPTEYQRRWRAKKKRSRAAQTPRMSEYNGSTTPEKAVACYEAYGVFKDEMAVIADADFESEQSRATAILASVIMFVGHDLPAARSFHTLHDLLYDMYDLTFGGRPPFFFKAKKPADVTTKPKIAFAHSVQGLLAIAYAALVGPGCKKPAEARQWLDDALKKWRLAALVSGEDIQGWYHQVTAKRGRPARMLAETFQEFQAQLSTLSSPAEAEAFAAQCLMLIAVGRPPSRLKLRS